MMKQKNIVDIFESSLETKFEPRYISDDVVTSFALCRLANELTKFYEEYQFFEKIPGELTPFLCPSLNISDELFKSYMRHDRNGFNMLLFVKRHLSFILTGFTYMMP